MQQEALKKLVQHIVNKKCYLIGICGIPGAGKSYISNLLNQKLKKSIVVPMDGFHLYRKDLTQQGIKYRGAPWTFDLQKFAKKVRKIKEKKFPLCFPSFDHAAKDPVEDSILITEDIQHVIIQGIYVFDKKIQLQGMWDLKIWIDVDLQEAVKRVANRHFASKIQQTIELCWKRANQNDRPNSVYILNNMNRNQCFSIENSQKL